MLSDPNRLKIIEILSCGERCACDLQAYFNFSQPTLSHHMKALVESELVLSRKDGQWSFYRLNPDALTGAVEFLSNLVHETADCLCEAVPHQNKCKKTENAKPCGTN